MSRIPTRDIVVALLLLVAIWIVGTIVHYHTAHGGLPLAAGCWAWGGYLLGSGDRHRRT